MDRLRAMAAFVAVTEAGSLSAAARALGEPLTNISRMLAQLEAHLGCALLHRSSRHLVITPAGSEYLETCRSVLESVAAAERRIAGQVDELSGDMAITAPVLFGRMFVVPLLARFLADYPRIDARLLLVDRVVEIAEEGIDIAVRIGELPDSALLATRVGSLRLVACAAPAYLERSGTPSMPSDLTRHDCVTFANLPGGLAGSSEVVATAVRPCGCARGCQSTLRMQPSLRPSPEWGSRVFSPTRPRRR